MNAVKHSRPDHTRPDHTMALLGDLLDGLRRDVLDAMRTRRSPAALRGLRSSQLRLLSLCPREGLRATDLAVRVGMSKQALGEFAAVLEEQGLLETVRDPADRRVRIWRPSRQGRRVVEAAELVIAETEARWRERFGAERWTELRDLLRQAAELGAR